MTNLPALRTGDMMALHRNVAWYKPQTWFAWKIMATTDSDYSHVGLIVNRGLIPNTDLIEYGDSGYYTASQLKKFTALHAFDPDGGSDWFVVEALFWGGVVIRPLSVYADTDKYRTDFYRPADDGGNVAAAWALRHVGEEYGKVTIMKLRVLQFLFDNQFVGDIHLPADIGWREGDPLICSQLVVRAWWQAGVDLGGDYADPQTVVENCKERVI